VNAGQSGAQAPFRDQAPGSAALLIIDMINCFDFDGAEPLQRKAAQAAQAIFRLKTAMAEAGFPVVYINDNFGEWHSERSRLIDRALAGADPAIAKIRPAEDDYFVIKPQFSGFYATNLPVLLPKLGVRRLILTGVATDICVLFTAADAHMRDYALWVPEDGVAAEDDERGRFALDMMRGTMAAETAASTQLGVAAWMERLDRDQADAG
jgi:nicotinamidase-related amidase